MSVERLVSFSAERRATKGEGGWRAGGGLRSRRTGPVEAYPRRPRPTRGAGRPHDAAAVAMGPCSRRIGYERHLAGSLARQRHEMRFSDLGRGQPNWLNVRVFTGWYVVTSGDTLCSIGVDVYVGPNAGSEWSAVQPIVDSIHLHAEDQTSSLASRREISAADRADPAQRGTRLLRRRRTRPRSAAEARDDGSQPSPAGGDPAGTTRCDGAASRRPAGFLPHEPARTPGMPTADTRDCTHPISADDHIWMLPPRQP
jgi:hypothetical protein